MGRMHVECLRILCTKHGRRQFEVFFIFFFFLVFYFSSHDAQANLPSRRGRDVPSSHKKTEYGVMIGKKEKEKKKKKKKKKKKPSQGQNWKRACEKKKKKVLNESEPQEARRPGRKGTLNRRASCPLVSRWLPSVSEAIGV